MSFMEPEPDAVQLPPPAVVQVHVAAASEAGKASATVALVTADGPVFDATIV
jgi:hypothetical protein